MFTNSRCKVWTLLIVILVTNKFCFCQISNCPKIFQYNFDGSDWFGIINLKDLRSGQAFQLNVEITLNGTIPKNYIGLLDLKMSQKQTLEYMIKFPIPPFLSKLNRITLNNNVICGGTISDENPIVSVLRVKQTVSGKIIFDTSIKGIEERLYVPTIDGPNLMINSSVLYRKDSSTNCGVLAGRFKHYAVDYSNGKFERGTWPWLAAIYVKSKSRKKLIYNCVGSLITKNAVLTAAICIRYTPNNITVYLGLHNLDEPEQEGVIKTDVSKTYTHPSFKPPSANGDIAILLLSDQIEFTEFIQPACLWTGPKELEVVVGEAGYYAGWGIDATGLQSQVPLKGDSKIVSQNECHQSHSQFIELTSNQTFCAGSQNGAGPCLGDAGSGFFIKKGARWILRGIVAKSLVSKDRRCDLFKYVVYTDVAQFVDWIKDTIKYEL